VGLSPGSKALRAIGAKKIFCETASGAKTDRAQLRRTIDGLGKRRPTIKGGG